MAGTKHPSCYGIINNHYAFAATAPKSTPHIPIFPHCSIRSASLSSFFASRSTTENGSSATSFHLTTTGLPLFIIGLIAARKHKGSLRTTALIGTILSLLMSTFVAVVMLFAW